MNFENFVLVFCNGEPPARERIIKLLPNPRFVACADGGGNKASALGFKPQLIVGDLDSLEQDGTPFFDVEIVKVDAQDSTDFEKTLSVLLDRGFNEFLVAAFSGGRIDQTFANLQIAYEYAKKCTLVMVEDQYSIFPVIERLSLYIPENTIVSIVPMEEKTYVTTAGLKYELNNALLRKGGQGISNGSTSTKVDITVHSGGVLVFVKDI
jgi:thiamine pyrophosphokinase